MEERELKSFEEFEAEVTKLINERDTRNAASPILISNYLFRGHQNKAWKLQTTLERYSDERISLKDYYRSVFAAKFQIESFTDRQWNILLPPEYNEYVNKQENLQFFHQLPGYEYLIYMRHHGFPSPFLDWSRSPYIALYFAYSEPSKTDFVSVYAYQEYSGGGKSLSSGKPYIQTLGPYANSHPRHFLQHSEYTICTIKDESENEFYYSSHENYFQTNLEEQDKLVKFILPMSERKKVLKKLDSFNLTAFTLFNNEESLMKTMALRELFFRKSK